MISNSFRKYPRIFCIMSDCWDIYAQLFCRWLKCYKTAVHIHKILSAKIIKLLCYSPWFSVFRFLTGTSPPSCWFTSLLSWQFWESNWVFSCSNWYMYSAVCWRIAACNQIFLLTWFVKNTFIQIKFLV